MRAPGLITSFVQWRWTPSVVLVVGSLAFVGVVVLVVPDDFDGVTSAADRTSRAAARGRATQGAEPVTETSLPSGSEEEEALPPSAAQRTAALPKRGNNLVQSIFHPIQNVELPVEPVDPNPPPPPPEAPLPPPTNTIYTLPTPPPTPPPAPGAPNAPAPAPEAPPAPVEPQGITGQ